MVRKQTDEGEDKDLILSDISEAAFVRDTHT